ncbi:hypothetical protein [Alteromonas gracilis]|uniref:hypothetical protein n=1 Tax=Alteromonas gracilis TaxID=1479524 RepID=UPI0032192B27
MEKQAVSRSSSPEETSSYAMQPVVEEDKQAVHHVFPWLGKWSHRTLSGVMLDVFIVLSWLAVWQIGRIVEYTEHASVWFPAAWFYPFLFSRYRASRFYTYNDSRGGHYRMEWPSLRA